MPHRNTVAAFGLALLACTSLANGQLTFANATTDNGLGSNAINAVYANGCSIYAATINGLGISTDGGGNCILELCIDEDADGIPDGCVVCSADLDGDGMVDGIDLGIMLIGWGSPAGDVTDDGQTDASDLAAMLGAWGPCPE
jgi:hypothetical protein